MAILNTKREAKEEAQRLAEKYDVKKRADGTFSIYLKGDPSETEISKSSLMAADAPLLKRGRRKRLVTDYYLKAAEEKQSKDAADEMKALRDVYHASLSEDKATTTPDLISGTRANVLSTQNKELIRDVQNVIAETEPEVEDETITVDETAADEVTKEEEVKEETLKPGQLAQLTLDPNLIHRESFGTYLNRAPISALDYVSGGLYGMAFGDPSLPTIEEFQEASKSDKPYLAKGPNIFNVKENLNNFKTYGTNWGPVLDLEYGLVGEMPGGMTGPREAMFGKGYAKEEMVGGVHDLPFSNLFYMFGTKPLRTASEIPKTAKKMMSMKKKVASWLPKTKLIPKINIKKTK